MVCNPPLPSPLLEKKSPTEAASRWHIPNCAWDPSWLLSFWFGCSLIHFQNCYLIWDMALTQFHSTYSRTHTHTMCLICVTQIDWNNSLRCDFFLSWQSSKMYVHRSQSFSIRSRESHGSQLQKNRFDIARDMNAMVNIIVVHFVDGTKI